MSFGKLVQDATSYVKKQTGIGDTLKSSTGLLNSALPWDKIESAKDPFFPALEIKSKNWDRLYPYRLLVIDARTNRPIGGDVQVQTTQSSGIDYVLTQVPMGGSWIYNFPITPQSISITDQFAINTTATMRGIVEEHNGVKFKMITMAGTTGLWPQKPTIAGVPKQPSIIGSLFGNTLESFSRVAKQAGKVAQAVTGEGNSTVAQKPEATAASLTSTGYYQAQILGQFLERYTIAKKDPNNKNWRLVLDIPKENQAFVVTPVSYTASKNQQAPMDSFYQLQFKAWKRIDLGDVPPAGQKPLSLGNPNLLQKINSTIRETRRTLGASINLVKAVRSDFQKPLNSLRQAALAVKDLGGFAFAVIDLPENVINDYKYSIKDSLFIVRNSFKRGPDGGGVGTSATGTTAPNLKSQSLEAKAGSAINAITTSVSNNEGVSGNFVSQGSLGTNSAQDQDLDPLNDVFANPASNFDLFDGLELSDLKLTPQQQQVVDDQILEASLTTIDDLNIIKKDLLDLALDISNNFGAGDAVYSQIYDRPAPQERIIPMSLEEYEILTSLYDTVQAIDILTATKQFDDTKTQSPLEYVGGLAEAAGVPFETATSKYLVPVPFGLTIEGIAARYLGDPDKWLEIVTLNNLRSPYIDEDGFTYNLLSNASGRQFNVNDSLQQLFIGQRILLRSDVVTSFSRKIINIEKISDTNYLVSVDGTADLDNLTIAQNASIQGYLPGTVNSQDQIYIPSNLPTEEDDRVAMIPAFANDKLTKISKVDWLLDDNGDLAINNVGDFRLANGLNNLVQALKLKISVEKNSLLRHPEFGLGIQPGVSVADISSGQIFNDLNKVVTDDPRFSGIERLDISINGPTITIDMAVSIANGSGIIPISFNV
jgi:hypothetical protein